LELFAHTEIFIFVFIEIVTKLGFVKNVFFQKPSKRDTIGFIVIFGLFSIFGTYIGTEQSLGVITNIRDLAPIVAGLVGGPVVDVSVGLIGGIHRLFLGGVTGISCSIATILAGLLAGLVFYFNKKQMLPIIPGNHNRWYNNQVQHITNGDNDANPNILEYPSGDDHPSKAGNLKATDEFMSLLNNDYTNQSVIPEYMGLQAIPVVLTFSLVATCLGKRRIFEHNRK
jgi:hypothetical protein